MSLGRRRYFVTFVALCGLGVTWGVMVAFDWASKLGTVALVPWTALLAFDLGALGGLCAAAAVATLWLVTANAQDVLLDNVQIGVRLGSMIALGIGAGLAGARLRASERAQRSVAALQSALIDSTLDGICLTDEHGRWPYRHRGDRRA